jgi:hypothetical protein
MKMHSIIIIALFFNSVAGYHQVQFDNLNKRSEKITMTTSVIVPCVARHFLWVSGLLESYENQTVKPDEVVISISEVEKLNPKEINDLEHGDYSFRLKIIRNNGVIMDGENRTIAMNNSSGDILIFSDADDIPHPQRVEIAKFIFENYEVDHILHGLTGYRSEIQRFDLQSIEMLYFDNFEEIQSFASSKNFPVTTGSPCFLRKVGNAIKWSHTKDVQHARESYAMFNNRILICSKLILYRAFLSSHSSHRSGLKKQTSRLD